ncbi:excinuclease ABC subunit C [Roseimicrobium gellanilyticum]|uniref:Excinuclease ABC subunit C n=1 Tax=Roseimicrobium gellanilyticum TaxID=748857 RepID=A0A366HSG8_9BACT|nr:UvrB/UvrC motif-containing protein [Roseimicrobium gellanilyticum]RBP47226.1 excinuclease ABC subunit C [Roseimicrobium gellanilyticum]
MSLSREKPDLQKKLHDVPHQPGVYVMRDRLNRPIYVGKARDLRKRLSSYFVPSNVRRADLKTKALIDSIWDFEIHLVRNEAESLLLEGRLIKDFRPRYNISFRDDKRFLLVKVQMADPFPRFTLTRLKKDDGARYFGPFAHSGALRTTLNWMNKQFGLRVCRPMSPDENDYRHCSNDIIKNCAAPCIGRVSPEEYRARVEQACDFLGGKSRDLVSALEEEMKKAAERLDFERAAELRDMIEDFKKTLKPTRSFERGARAKVVSTLDPMADVSELQEYLRLDRPPLVMECFDIANIGTAHCVASMVRFKNGVPDNANYRRYRIRIVSGQNDFAAMSEVVRRRYSRILLEGRERMGAEEADLSQEDPLEAMRRLEEDVAAQEEEDASEDADALTDNEGDEASDVSTESTASTQSTDAPESASKRSRRSTNAKGNASAKTKFVRLPDLVIIDGGKGQLSSAMEELQRLGLHELPVVGLAKEEEEIYRPGVDQPLRIPHDRGALKLLQRIRDEAHRWANGYHQLLLRRRVEESILDDCPGVSQTRKANILRVFGSVARLRRATVEEVAKVPGIGKGLAEEIVRFLKEREG